MGQTQSSKITNFAKFPREPEYYSRLEYEARCSELRKLTDYSQIMELIRVYPDYADVIKSCPRELWVGFNRDAVVFSFEEFQRWTELRETDVFVVVTTPEQYEYLINDRKLQSVNILLGGDMDPTRVSEKVYKMQNMTNAAYEFLIGRSRNTIPLKSVGIASEASFNESGKRNSVYRYGLGFNYDRTKDDQIIVSYRDLDPALVDRSGNQIYLKFIQSVLNQTKFPIQRILFVGEFPFTNPFTNVLDAIEPLIQLVNPSGIGIDYSVSVFTSSGIFEILKRPTIDYFSIEIIDRNVGLWTHLTTSWHMAFDLMSDSHLRIDHPMDLNLTPILANIIDTSNVGMSFRQDIRRFFPQIRKFIVSHFDVDLISRLKGYGFPVVVELPAFELKNIYDYVEVLRMEVPIIFDKIPEDPNDIAELRHFMSLFPNSLIVKNFA